MSAIRYKDADLVGKKFGRLTVEDTWVNKTGVRICACICDCGQHHEVRLGNLRSESVGSCGCLGRERRMKHGATVGGTTDRLYWVWSSMTQRCENENSVDFKYYGGRGIAVCEEWKASFALFQGWAIANGYSVGLQIDRKDNSGDYSPENCRWVDRQTNGRNRRSNVLMTLNGVTMPAIAWAERLGISGATLRKRRKDGWSDALALTTPVKRSVVSPCT